MYTQKIFMSIESYNVFVMKMINNNMQNYVKF